MTDEQSGKALHKWRITLLTSFPKSLLSDLSAGLPQKLDFGSRIKESATRVGNIMVRLSPAQEEFPEPAPMELHDPVHLSFELDASTAEDATETATSAIDLVVDDLSFQLQEPLRIFTMRALDITPPLKVGDTREFSQWNGWDQYKLSRSTPMGATHPVAFPSLRDHYTELDQRVQDALDWYIKSMHTPWDADRYIFLWICFEILRSKFGEKIEEPTRLRCGHDLIQCPECNKPTSQVRQAASTHKFMEAFGVDERTAKNLWDMRQLIHGAKSFKREKLERLGELLQILRALRLPEQGTDY